MLASLAALAVLCMSHYACHNISAPNQHAATSRCCRKNMHAYFQVMAYAPPSQGGQLADGEVQRQGKQIINKQTARLANCDIAAISSIILMAELGCLPR